MSFERTPLLDTHDGETIVFEATLLREPFESSRRSSYLMFLGPLLQCMCYPCAKRQARKVADSWRFYVTEETLCFYLVERNLYGCSFPQVSMLLVVKSWNACCYYIKATLYAPPPPPPPKYRIMSNVSCTYMQCSHCMRSLLLHIIGSFRKVSNAYAKSFPG